MRVLMVTQVVDLDDPGLGFTHTWVNALAQHVDELHVVTLVAGRHDLVGSVVLHAYGPPAASHSRLSRFRFYNQCFAKLILGGRIDVIFVHMIPRWVIMAAPYARARRLPSVLWYTHAAVSWQLRIAHHLADQVVTASRESYSLWDERKVVALGHGIDTDYFSPAHWRPDGAFRILTVGRLSPIKHHEVLIEAMRILVHERGMDNVRARIVGGPARPGDGEYAAKLRRMIDCDLRDYVTFVGPLSYEVVVQEYQRCDLFVNFSQTGSLDKAMLEAMACGVPVVTSNRAFQSMLTQVREQLWVPHGNGRSVAESMARVISLEPEQRQNLGMTLRKNVEEEHSLFHMVQRLAVLLSGQVTLVPG